MVGTYNFTINQGESFTRTLTWNDSDNNPIDLTNYTARMQLRCRKDSNDIIISLTTENGRITLGGELGTIALKIDAIDTESLDFSDARYDLEMIDGSNIVTRLLEGIVKLNKEVTR